MAQGQSNEFRDRLGRPLRELRVSVTDRCNFRCRYCMPREHFGPETHFVQRSEILDFEAIVRVARVLRGRGLQKLRLTGGEPLLRREVSELVRQLRTIPGLELAMTTNGSLLTRHAGALRAAGLDRLTVSLDALDDSVFRRMTDSRFSPRSVLDGIAAAKRAGFSTLKINCVIQRGKNEGEILPLVERFRHSGHELRFIEYMDTGETNGWREGEVFPATEILQLIGSRYPLIAEDPATTSQTSRMYRYRDGAGRVGVIASVSQPFCGGCTRARLTAKGELYTCLFGTSVLDVRQLIRTGATDDELLKALGEKWSERSDRYSESRAQVAPSPSLPLWNVPVSGLLRTRLARSEMSYLGG